MEKKTKILCIDYGSKWSGLSISDTDKKLAMGLTCINTDKLINSLKDIIKIENIYLIVLGYPINLNNKHQKITKQVLEFKTQILKKYPKIIVDLIDERYTSQLAKYYLYKFKYRKTNFKSQLNVMSSILILQSYLKVLKKK
ncbi:MAG: Holliday junction resolvase RuvX [Candidatus Shikimatogenerans bostrichidophilus]|nr:MAG: Holliday junction resolvase RuvX [Candidatus Shikimatogenerans bostrichidophilus]